MMAARARARQVEVVLQVVHGRQAVIEQLLGVVEMREIGAAVRRAALARAARLDGARIVAVLGVGDVEPPARMNSWPLRALRVGITQSNMSMPARIPARRSSGVPTPIR